jgi:hypothetical protein
MRYGSFDDARREYVINRPDTPLPWANYLGTEAYFGIISNTAGGYSFYQDARLRRLTVPQLEELLEYEKANADRASFVGMLARRIGTARAAEEHEDQPGDPAEGQ